MTTYVSALLAVVTQAAALQPQPDTPRDRAAKKELKSPAGSKRLLATFKRIRPKNEEVALPGLYRSESIQEDGTKYIAEAVIERVGEAYIVTYKKGPVTAYVGIGVRQGDMFCMA